MHFFLIIQLANLVDQLGQRVCGPALVLLDHHLDRVQLVDGGFELSLVLARLVRCRCLYFVTRQCDEFERPPVIMVLEFGCRLVKAFPRYGKLPGPVALLSAGDKVASVVEVSPRQAQPPSESRPASSTIESKLSCMRFIFLTFFHLT